MGVEVEVKSTFSAACPRGPAAAPPAGRSSVGVGVALVGVRHYVTSFFVLCRRDVAWCIFGIKAHFFFGSRRGVGLYITCGGVHDCWRGASVACWLVSKCRRYSEGYFPWGFSVCRLGSPYNLSVRESF